MVNVTLDRAQLEVASIEVDGLCEDIANLLAKYPGLPEPVVRQISRATAELIGARALLDQELER